MRQYDLGSEEGVLLMCVAEALLRIPDQDTADKLIRDKLADADWEKHLGGSDSVLVNASTWGLMLTGKLVQMNDATRADAPSAFKRLVGRVGEPVVRLAVRQAMKIMGHQFVMGAPSAKRWRARTRRQRQLPLLVRHARRRRADHEGRAALPGRLPSCDPRHRRRSQGPRWPSGRRRQQRAGHLDQAVGAVPALRARQARARAEGPGAGRAGTGTAGQNYGIGCTVDAEESDRLELSLDIIEQVFSDASLAGWDGFGVVVQAYQKRTPYTIDHLADMARRAGRRLQVRLVKGAYWDAEIKRADRRLPATRCSPVSRTPMCPTWPAPSGCSPMRTRSTRCSPRTTHTIAAVRSIANGGVYEHQKLHGMGDDLYAEVVPADRLNLPCRVYAPVGSHEDLLPYLVRRLLENGANSSFVNRITDERVPIADLIRDPVEMVASFESIPHPKIRCRLTCCAARTTTGRTPWAPTSPTTTNCAPWPSRSTRPSSRGRPLRWYRVRTRPAPRCR